MMVTFNINIGRKEAVFFVAFFVLVIGVGGVIAYGGNNPLIMGHSAGELEFTASNCPSGQVVVGINSDGTLNCSSGSGLTVPDYSDTYKILLSNVPGDKYCNEGYVLVGATPKTSKDDHTSHIMCGRLIISP